MNKNIYFLLLIWVLSNGSCKDPYGPPTQSVNESYLVVEGYLNGSGITTIRVSKTFKLDDTARFRPELGAFVQVQSKGGQSFSLTNAGNGIYRIAQLPMRTDEQYRLLIKNSSGDYYSDYVPYKPTPQIDSITWDRNEKGVQIYANTHDPANKTIFYRWAYDETWEFHSAYTSYYEYKNGQVVERDPNQNIYRCWISNSSSRILLGSSAKLQKDVITFSPITSIPNKSWMLSVKYSINLYQYALDEAGYQYWQNLKKVSEQLGSIFDSQPSEIRGNIHSVNNPNELVIGYISAGTVQEKRLFIKSNEVPAWGYMHSCEQFITSNNKDSIEFFFKDGGYIPIDMAFSPTGAMIGWFYSTALCVDCRLRGTNVKPPFWQ